MNRVSDPHSFHPDPHSFHIDPDPFHAHPDSDYAIKLWILNKILIWIQESRYIADLDPKPWFLIGKLLSSFTSSTCTCYLNYAVHDLQLPVIVFLLQDWLDGVVLSIPERANNIFVKIYI
jgi:hypothetical protein